MIDLLLVLSLLAAGELPAQSGKSSKANPPAPAPAPVQEGERPFLSAAEIKLLKDSNIFAPRSKRPRIKETPKGPGSRPEAPSAPQHPKPPVITGIFFDAKAQAFLVVVEDRNTVESLKLFKEPKFLKPGDEVVGYKVASVTAEKAVFVRGEISKELKVGETIPGADGKAVSAAPAVDDPEAPPFLEGDEKVEIKPQDEETKHKTLDEMRKKVGKKNRPSREE